MANTYFTNRQYGDPIPQEKRVNQPSILPKAQQTPLPTTTAPQQQQTSGAGTWNSAKGVYNPTGSTEMKSGFLNAINGSNIGEQALGLGSSAAQYIGGNALSLAGDVVNPLNWLEMAGGTIGGTIMKGGKSLMKMGTGAAQMAYNIPGMAVDMATGNMRESEAQKEFMEGGLDMISGGTSIVSAPVMAFLESTTTGRRLLEDQVNGQHTMNEWILDRTDDIRAGMGKTPLSQTQRETAEYRLDRISDNIGSIAVMAGLPKIKAGIGKLSKVPGFKSIGKMADAYLRAQDLGVDLTMLAADHLMGGVVKNVGKIAGLETGRAATLSGIMKNAMGSKTGLNIKPDSIIDKTQQAINNNPNLKNSVNYMSKLSSSGMDYAARAYKAAANKLKRDVIDKYKINDVDNAKTRSYADQISKAQYFSEPIKTTISGMRQYIMDGTKSAMDRILNGDEQVTNDADIINLEKNILGNMKTTFSPLKATLEHTQAVLRDILPSIDGAVEDSAGVSSFVKKLAKGITTDGTMGFLYRMRDEISKLRDGDAGKNGSKGILETIDNAIHNDQLNSASMWDKNAANVIKMVGEAKKATLSASVGDILPKLKEALAGGAETTRRFVEKNAGKMTPSMVDYMTKHMDSETKAIFASMGHEGQALIAELQDAWHSKKRYKAPDVDPKLDGRPNLQRLESDNIFGRIGMNFKPFGDAFKVKFGSLVGETPNYLTDKAAWDGDAAARELFGKMIGINDRRKTDLMQFNSIYFGEQANEMITRAKMIADTQLPVTDINMMPEGVVAKHALNQYELLSSHIDAVGNKKGVELERLGSHQIDYSGVLDGVTTMLQKDFGDVINEKTGKLKATKDLKGTSFEGLSKGLVSDVNNALGVIKRLEQSSKKGTLQVFDVMRGIEAVNNYLYNSDLADTTKYKTTTKSTLVGWAKQTKSALMDNLPPAFDYLKDLNEQYAQGMALKDNATKILFPGGEQERVRSKNITAAKERSGDALLSRTYSTLLKAYARDKSKFLESFDAIERKLYDLGFAESPVTTRQLVDFSKLTSFLYEYSPYEGIQQGTNTKSDLLKSKYDPRSPVTQAVEGLTNAVSFLQPEVARANFERYINRRLQFLNHVSKGLDGGVFSSSATYNTGESTQSSDNYYPDQ